MEDETGPVMQDCFSHNTTLISGCHSTNDPWNDHLLHHFDLLIQIKTLYHTHACTKTSTCSCYTHEYTHCCATCKQLTGIFQLHKIVRFCLLFYCLQHAYTSQHSFTCDAISCAYTVDPVHLFYSSSMVTQRDMTAMYI